jgi:hypothetical protein
MCHAVIGDSIYYTIPGASYSIYYALAPVYECKRKVYWYIPEIRPIKLTTFDPPYNSHETVLSTIF